MPGLQKIRSTVFYLRDPRYWPHFIQRAKRCVQPNLDTAHWQVKATRWAQLRTKPLAEILFRFGLTHSEKAIIPKLDDRVLQDAQHRTAQSGCKIDGPGYIDPIYVITRLTRATAVIETGVGHGWNSLAFLTAMAEAGHGGLVSVDKPYPGAANEPDIGIAVADKLKGRWKLIREPDRNGLRKAIAQFPEGIDIAHYDSDKSHQGRQFGYPKLWNALKPGGLFVSNDIQDNMAFANFVEERGLHYGVAEANGKYLGLAIKLDRLR
ncbi:MAG TPA: class I SAM-dependent methyltransferase [Rhizomicrobium sp.]|nr:class I SAM-dependent methyltransferase [Rhizomicrobium sp.]